MNYCMHIVADKWLLCVSLQTMEMARNPAMLQEMMRQQDRAMSNLEVIRIMLICEALILNSCICNLYIFL